MGAAHSSAYDNQAQLARKLSSGQFCIVGFMSPGCGLCASLRPALDEMAGRSGLEANKGVYVAVLNSQADKLWAPEMLAYSVESVPCFVLVDQQGRAICKTPPPASRRQMQAALQQLSKQIDG